jgi:hypothetical protein
VIDIVLMAGQSNMVGWKTSADDLAPRWRGQVKNSFVWQKGAWAPLKVEGGYQKKGFGPELSFAHAFQETTVNPVGIVKVAENGTFLSREWNPEAEDALLDRLISEARAAMADSKCRLRGLMWMQGEADAITKEDAGAYLGRFRNLITKLRVRLGCPTLPVIAGLVNPPEDQCPHASKVRKGLSKTEMDYVYTVDCSGLTRRKDALHYDVKGISVLGRKFATELIERSAEMPAPLTRQWLWNSNQYQAWFEGSKGTASDVVVTFPHAMKDHGFDEAGFGQKFFAKHDIPAVHIQSNISDWYQNDEIFEVTKAIRDYLHDAIQVVAYGASMGAYGALLTSKALEADKVIAIAPQFSIDRAAVPWETRWKRAAKRIGLFKHDINDLVINDTLKCVFYDPLSTDKRQVEMFNVDESWRLVTFPLASHQVLQFLLETGTLPVLMHDLFGDGPHVQNVMDHARANRRQSKLYWMTLASEAAVRRPELAERAISRAQELGAPPRKVRQIRSVIEDSMNKRNNPAA